MIGWTDGTTPPLCGMWHVHVHVHVFCKSASHNIRRRAFGDPARVQALCLGVEKEGKACKLFGFFLWIC